MKPAKVQDFQLQPAIIGRKPAILQLSGRISPELPFLNPNKLQNCMNMIQT
jgi:hypothetical protein